MSSEMRELMQSVLDFVNRQPCRCMSIAQLGERDYCDRCQSVKNLRALLARTEAGAGGGAPICLFDATNPCDGTCGECHHLHASPKDASPVADGAVAFRWKSGGTANKPRWVYAEAGSKSIPPVGAHPLFTHPQDASGDAEEVICEHSGCGHGPQANQVPVTLWPGDKVLMRRGRLGAAMQAKEAK